MLGETLCDGGDLLQAGDNVTGFANAGFHLGPIDINILPELIATIITAIFAS